MYRNELPDRWFVMLSVTRLVGDVTTMTKYVLVIHAYLSINGSLLVRSKQKSL